MNDKEKALEEHKYRFIKKLFKSLFYTTLIFFFTIFVILFIIELVSGSGSETSVIISFCISIIFIIFYCTMTIVDEIKKIK